MKVGKLVLPVIIIFSACDIVQDNPYDQWEGKWRNDSLSEVIFVFHRDGTWGIEVSLTSGVSTTVERVGTYSLTDTRYTMTQVARPELGIEQYTGTGNWRRKGNTLTLYLDRGTTSVYRKISS